MCVHVYKGVYVNVCMCVYACLCACLGESHLAAVPQLASGVLAAPAGGEIALARAPAVEHVTEISQTHCVALERGTTESGHEAHAGSALLLLLPPVYLGNLVCVLAVEVAVEVSLGLEEPTAGPALPQRRPHDCLARVLRRATVALRPHARARAIAIPLLSAFGRQLMELGAYLSAESVAIRAQRARRRQLVSDAVHGVQHVIVHNDAHLPRFGARAERKIADGSAAAGQRVA